MRRAARAVGLRGSAGGVGAAAAALRCATFAESNGPTECQKGDYTLYRSCTESEDQNYADA